MVSRFSTIIAPAGQGELPPAAELLVTGPWWEYPVEIAAGTGWQPPGEPPVLHGRFGWVAGAPPVCCPEHAVEIGIPHLEAFGS